MTLFALQIFRSVLNNGHNIFGADVTGGVNGILQVDPLSWFGHALPVSHQGLFNPDYLYVALGFFGVVYVALRFVNASRTGRAWRALREDPLAAASMGMPVDWLKLLAFAFGAGIAALTGTLTASVNAAVFPDNFDVPQLITIYAMVILGGAGSQAGAVVGVVVVNVMLEALRSPDNSRWVFYLAVLLVLIPSLKLRRWSAVVAGTIAFGFAAHAIAGAISHDWTAGHIQGGGAVTRAVAHWAIIPVPRPDARDLVRRADRRGARRHLAQGQLEAGRPRADALPRLLRVGERAGAAARDHALHPARRDPRGRDDDPACRHPGRAKGRDHMSAGATGTGAAPQPLLELRGVSMAFGGLRSMDKLDLVVNEERSSA